MLRTNCLVFLAGLCQLHDQVEQVRAVEKPAVDDGLDITTAARRRLPELIRLLKPSQVANYLGENADEIRDPAERLNDSLDTIGRRASSGRDRPGRIDVEPTVAGSRDSAAEIAPPTRMRWHESVIQGRSSCLNS
jgi:hypothetical protein